MDEDLLRQVAADMNQAPDSASRVGRSAALVSDVNAHIADVARRRLPFDSTPYAYQVWLAETDKT